MNKGQQTEPVLDTLGYLLTFICYSWLNSPLTGVILYFLLVGG